MLAGIALQEQQQTAESDDIHSYDDGVIIDTNTHTYYCLVLYFSFIFRSLDRLTNIVIVTRCHRGVISNNLDEWGLLPFAAVEGLSFTFRRRQNYGTKIRTKRTPGLLGFEVFVDLQPNSQMKESVITQRRWSPGKTRKTILKQNIG